MSPLNKKSDSRSLARKIWSAWMRFGSPRVSVDHQSPHAHEDAGAVQEPSSESDFDVHNEYFTATGRL